MKLSEGLFTVLLFILIPLVRLRAELENMK